MIKYLLILLLIVSCNTTTKSIKHSSNKRNKEIKKIQKFKGRIENLGSQVNTKYAEILPVISPDGNTLYFVRNNYPGNIGASDIYISKIKDKNKWYPAYNAGKEFNSRFYDTIYSLTPDGNKIFGTFEGQIGIKKRTKRGWSKIYPVKINDFYNKCSYTNFFLSNDSQTLLISLWRNDSYVDHNRKLPKNGGKFGYTDIYVSFKNEDNTWSSPMNLGPVVNSIDTEFSPFLASDNKTLYFASYGHKGYGSADIFMSTRLDDSWRNWSQPLNLGSKINSEKWDAYLSVPASGKYVYFVSTKNSIGKGDICRMELPINMRPTPVVLIYGNVLDASTNENLAANIIYERLDNGKIVGSAETNPITGEYKIVLPSGHNYAVRANADGYFGINENIDLTDLKKYSEISKNLKLSKLEKGQTIRLSNIFFEYNKHELRVISYPELDRVVKFLNDNKRIKILISGHTDDVGSDNYNLKLSKMRAKSVAEYIVSKGILNKRIKFNGYGESKPINSNKTEYGRIMNRRVEFTILSK